MGGVVPYCEGGLSRSVLRRHGSCFWLLSIVLLVFFVSASQGSVGGSISGTVTDASGAVVAKAAVTAINTETGVHQAVASDEKGFYSLQSLQIGHYDLEVTSTAFRPYRRTGIVINANSALTIDVALEVGARSDAVTVVEDQIHVETTSTQGGEVITAAQMTAVPLISRSYTDLLSLQPGVAPVTTITSDTVQDVGASAFAGQRMGDRVLRIEKLAAVGKAIGGDIEHRRGGEAQRVGGLQLIARQLQNIELCGIIQ